MSTTEEEEEEDYDDEEEDGMGWVEDKKTREGR